MGWPFNQNLRFSTKIFVPESCVKSCEIYRNGDEEGFE